jgi:hypothetical protein
MRYPLGDGHGLSSSGGLVYQGQGWLMGWLLTAEAAATAAVVGLTDGNDANGDQFGVLRIPADTTLVHSRSVPGMPLEMGLVLTPTVPVSGSVIIGRYL